MPVNKAARIRYELIDACLRNTMQKWTIKKLEEVLNKKLKENYGEKGKVAARTISEDLNNMRLEYGAPIESSRSGNNVIYRYSDPSFSIANLPVDDEDIEKLNQAVHLLNQIKGFNIAGELAEVVQRLEQRVKFAGDQPQSVIAFENPPAAQGSENLGDLFEAIIKKRVLKIAYKHFWAQAPDEHVIHPYYLKEFNNRWYLFGWSEKNNRIENMALDRMVFIKVAPGIRKENNDFNPEIYFAHIIGVSNMGTAIEKIELVFSKERAPYLLTRPIHSSQKHIETLPDGKVVMEFLLIINRELITLIMSFGNDVEVKSPESLRLQVKELHEKAIRNYE